jgi:predicted GNAT family N-acyltransferase
MLSIHDTATVLPPPPAARVARSATERTSAFRLRYDVYIAEQGKPYPDADHQDRLLTDELDDDGAIIIATAYDTTVIATVRANWFDEVATRASYAATFEIDRFPAVPHAAMAVCTRLAAHSEHRHSIARAQLFEALYHVGLDRGTRLAFAACARPLLRLFRSYGFREYAEPVEDPIVGTLHRTVLALDDLSYLTSIDSPFVPIANARGLTASTSCLPPGL